SNLKGLGHIFVGIFTEADVTVADLQKAEVGSCRQRVAGLGDLGEGSRHEDAAADRPKQAGAGPSHALKKAAAVDPVVFVVARNVIGHNIWFYLGWWVAFTCVYRFGVLLFPKLLVSNQYFSTLLLRSEFP